MIRLSALGGIMMLFLLGCAHTGGLEVPTREDALYAHSEVVLTVYGLSCPLCSNNLDGQLRRVDGVTGAEIDLETGAVRVSFEEGHTVQQNDLQKAVQDAGFTLQNIAVQEP